MHSLPLIAASAAALAIAAIAWITYSRRLRKALPPSLRFGAASGRDETDALGADRP